MDTVYCSILLFQKGTEGKLEKDLWNAMLKYN